MLKATFDINDSNKYTICGDLNESFVVKHAEIYLNHIIQRKKLEIEIEKIKLARKLSFNSIAIAIGAIVFAVILFVSVYEWSRHNDNVANEIKIKNEQSKLEREKFEYNKSEQNKIAKIKSSHS